MLMPIVGVVATQAHQSEGQEVLLRRQKVPPHNHPGEEQDDPAREWHRGTAQHQDPEFETFTYGDYLWKPAKINLARMTVGDWIFFNETLIPSEHKRPIPVAAM